MSTASPLPLQPLPDAHVSTEQQLLLKQEVALRLQQHRRRRHPHPAQQALMEMEPVRTARRTSRVADSVAARYAQKMSYRDLLAHEAEAATRQAEAAAEVARRNADAIAQAQQQLLSDIECWERTAEDATEGTQTPYQMESVTARALPVPIAVAPTPPAVTAMPLTREAQASVVEVTPQIVAPQIVAPQTVAPQTVAEAPSPVFDPLQALKAEPQEPPTGLPTNLIEFPRQLVAARKARPRLAEGPLLEEANRSPEQAQLRIFEVEPEQFSTVPLPTQESVLPEWSNIRLDSWQAPHETAVPDAQVSLAMPLYTAAVSTRCMAAAVDILCLSAVFLVAVATAGYASPVLPTGIAALIAAAVSFLLLGVLYLVFFFTFTEATPGMRYARIAFCTFNDENPTRSAMRRRLLATALSTVPMGLGLLWAWLDDDRLGWHDRMSRMYQREY